MNEQQLADQLGALIDNRTPEASGQLPVEESAFALRLLTLRDQTHADAAFADALGASLKAARSPFRNRLQTSNREVNRRANTHSAQGRLVYTMATFAAALVIVVAAVLTVPPLRTLTQDVYSQLVAQSVTATQPVVSAPTVLPEQPAAGYVLATAPLSSSFHVLGQVFHANDFAVNLVESAFTSYIHLMSSVTSKSVSS